MENFYFIIPASGIGTRMQANIPKQYLHIHHKPILQYVLDAFLNLSLFEKGILVLNEHDHFWPTLDYQHPNDHLLQLVTGGKRRDQSVLNGCLAIAMIDKSNPWILVHDAVRPGILSSQIQTLCQTLINDPVGGIFATQAIDTIKAINPDGTISKTLNRNRIYLAQTPQMFRLNTLIQAITHCHTQHIEITDEASAVEALGLHPRIIEGNPNNFKITYPSDLKKMAISLENFP